MDTSFNEFYRYNCVLHDYQKENDELKKEIERLNEENKRLRKVIENLQRENELKDVKINRLGSINNIHVKSLEMAINIIRKGADQ